jgi:RNA 3'-terminal phosphate cyclase
LGEIKSGDCITKQSVKVYASEQPVISSVDITNNTITVNVSGGTAPYKYSLDGIKWQILTYLQTFREETAEFL